MASHRLLFAVAAIRFIAYDRSWEGDNDMFAFVIALAVLAVGLLICCGSLYVLLHQKIVVDESGNVSEIELPVIGKLKTNYPSLIGLGIGAMLSYGVLVQWSAVPDTLPLKAGITLIEEGSQAKRDVFLGVALPHHYRVERMDSNRSHFVEFPIITSGGSTGGHFAVAYTIVGIDPNGYAQRIVDAGNIKYNSENGYAEFTAELRLPAALKE